VNGVLAATAISFGIIFMAELGDKSQLMALTFATRYRAMPVLIGITVATATVHAVSVAVGHGLYAALPTGWIRLIAGIAYLGFAAWTLRGDSLDEAEEAKSRTDHRSVIVAASTAFFLAEIGDRTMLATITLASQYGWLGVWAGSTLGMVAADALAIAVGAKLGKRLPTHLIALAGAVLLTGFGVWLTVEALVELRLPVLTAGVDHHLVAWIALVLACAVLIGTRLHRARAVGRSGSEPGAAHPVTRGAQALPRLLLVLATVLGLAAPLLVATDIVQPIGLLGSPGFVVVGAALLLLGMSVILAAQSRVASARRGDEARRGERVLITQGVFGRVRNPAFTGMIVATAGMLIMVPTILAVFSAILVVTAVQLQARLVIEPALQGSHGDAYQNYARNTGRFVPRIRRP
jgi:putative Ca2+/H+ antiporter (TMEM165/GDT1 family)/protein-S-isoprenylcysteine O-methyltransferase Ste14